MHSWSVRFQSERQYSRSPKNPTLQLSQKSSISASTTPQRPIWNTVGTVAVRDFWENGCSNQSRWSLSWAAKTPLSRLYLPPRPIQLAHAEPLRAPRPSDVGATHVRSAFRHDMATPQTRPVAAATAPDRRRLPYARPEPDTLAAASPPTTTFRHNCRHGLSRRVYNPVFDRRPRLCPPLPPRESG